MKQKLENQLLIKFPDELCDEISKGIDSGKLPMITLRPIKNPNTNNSKDEPQYQREFSFQITSNPDKTYHTKLMDLPCIIESQKTYNKNLYFKTGDISQMLIVSDEHKSETTDDTDNEHRYKLDSGITPPSQDIRERWSHMRPICYHDDVDINKYCPKCHNIPRGLINQVSQEIYDRMHGQASEAWDLITTEEWIEVTDSESEDGIETEMDRKLKNSQTINDREWEESDEDIDIVMDKSAKNVNNTNVNNNNTNSKSETDLNVKVRKSPNIKTSNVSVKSESQKRGNLNRNSLNRRPLSGNRSQKTVTSNSMSRVNSLKRGGASLRSNTKSAQPPLPFISPMTISQRRTTPRKVTPRRKNTPLIGGSANNLIKGNVKVSNKVNREKRVLEERLKTKQIELKMQEEKYSKQKNRKMKKKIGLARDALKQEIAQMQSKLSAM